MGRDLAYDRFLFTLCVIAPEDPVALRRKFRH